MTTTAAAHTGFTSFRQALASLPKHKRTASAVLRDQHIRDTLRLLEDLQRPLAMQILDKLRDHPEGMTAGDIAVLLPRKKNGKRTSVNGVQQLLMVLRRHGVIDYTKVGKEHIYTNKPKELKRIQKAIHRFIHPLTTK